MGLKVLSKYILIFLILLLLLISPGFVVLYVQNEPIDMFVCFFTGLAIFAIPFVLFYKRMRLYFYLLTIFAILAPLAWIPPVEFGIGINTDIIILVLNTSFREAYELFGSVLIPFIIFILVYVSLYFFLVRLVPGKIPFRTALTVSLSGIFLLLAVTFIYRGATNYKNNVKSLVFSYYPFDLMYSVVKYSKKFVRIDHKELVKDFRFGAVKNDTLPEREIYVLVIGETARFNNFGINGYARNTTPRLSGRTDIINFRDVASAGALTGVSVPLIVTRATPENYDLHYRERSVSEAFHEAGFFTYWITNQIDYFNIKMHCEESDSLISLVAGDKQQGKKSDMDLANVFFNVIKNDRHKKLFFVLHTMGSHFSYNQRYPESFNVFKPSGDKGPLNPTRKSNKEIMVNSYDNSILYTDMVLDTLMTTLSQQNAVSYLLYLSDHGENLYDDDRGLFLHAPIEPSRYVAHIPFVIWTSTKYDATYPHKQSILKKNEDRPLSSKNVFETLLNMSNIGYPGSDSTQSISSRALKDSKQEVLGGNMILYQYRNLK